MLDTLTVDDFAPHVGDVFVTGDAGASQPLHLLSATPLRQRGAGSRPGFALLFRGAPTPVFEQRVHRVIHPGRGAMDVFLVPVGPDEQGMRYEAIFN